MKSGASSFLFLAVFFASLSSVMACDGGTRKTSSKSTDKFHSTRQLSDGGNYGLLTTGPYDPSIRTIYSKQWKNINDVHREASFHNTDQTLENRIHQSKTKPSPRKKYNASIRIAAKGNVFLYLNGKRIAFIPSNNGIRAFNVNLLPGDVVAFSSFATRAKVGIIANIYYKGRHYYTGSGSSKYKIIAWTPARQSKFLGFAEKKFSSCNWLKPIPMKMKPKYNFPDQSSYIWINDKGKPAKAVLVRFVVGGENCGGGVRYCRCRRETGQRKGTCYDMRRKYQKVGRCTRRQCGAKYICEAGNKKLPLCILRYARYRVVRKSSTSGPKICHRIAIDPPTRFSVPYSG